MSRYLIIPDIHDKIARAQAIIDQVKHDRIIFLGDFFDDFTTGVKQARETAIWLKGHIHRLEVTTLLGNHDMSYGWGSLNPRFLCSGWSREKSDAIHSVMGEKEWRAFKLAFELITGRGARWMFTHAGLHNRLKNLDVSQAYDCLERAHMHPLLDAGWARGGGWDTVGGLNWCDWDREFELIQGLNQICGHTPGKIVRIKRQGRFRNICLDTHLNHYAVLDSAKGTLRIMDIGEIP